MHNLIAYGLILASVALGIWTLLHEERLGGREQLTYVGAMKAVEVQFGTGLLGMLLLAAS